MRAPGRNPPMQDMPRMSPEEAEAIEAGKRFARLEESQLYQDFMGELHDRLFRAIVDASSAVTADEALQRCGVLNEIMGVVGIASGKAQLGREVAEAFRARYEAAARGSHEARLRAQNGGFRARGAAGLTT